MKQFSFSLLLVLFCSVGYGQLSNTQATVITKVSADWCINCGTWGWTAFEQMRTQFEDKEAILVLAHYDGNLKNNVSDGWTDNLKHQGQPVFFLNNDNQNLLSNNVNAKLVEMNEQIDFLSDFGAFVGVEGFGFLVNGDKLNAEVKVEFFSETPGDYYLGVYTLQNNIIANQSGQGMVQQPKLLTGAFTDEWYGISIPGTTGLQTFDMEMDRPADFSAVEGDTEILSVVWNKLPDGTYVMFNANVNSTIVTSSSANELAESIVSFNSSLIQNELNVNFDSMISADDASITLTNIAGQKIFSSTALSIREGSNAFNFNVSGLTTGMYIATMKIGNKLISQKNIRI